MANIDFPRGFVPVKRKGNSVGALNYYDISTTNSEIGVYDLVHRGADGFIDRATAGSTTIVGVASEHIAANTGGKVAVYDADDWVFNAQVDDATVNAQTDLDLNYDIVVGVPVNGRSIMEIDGSTQAANVDLPIKILRVASVTSQDGNALGANVLVDCVINRGIFKSGALG